MNWRITLLSVLLFAFFVKNELHAQRCGQIYLEQRGPVDKDTLILDVKVRGVKDLIGIGTGFTWDPKVFSSAKTFNYALRDMSNSNFGPSDLTVGQLRFSWFSSGLLPTSLPDNSTLFSVKFSVSDRISTSTQVRFINPRIFSTEFSDINDNQVSVGVIGTRLLLKNQALANRLKIEELCFSGNNCDPLGLGSGLAVSGGQAPYGYLWEGPNGFRSTESRLQGVPAGAYFLRVNSANQDTIHAYVIIPNPILGVRVSFVQTCDGQSARYIASPQSGEPPYRYELSDGRKVTQSTPWEFVVQAGANLTLTITDSKGCKSDYPQLGLLPCLGNDFTEVGMKPSSAFRDQEVCIPVYAKGMDKTGLLRFSVKWPSRAFDFVGFRNGNTALNIGAQNFNTSQTAEGTLDFSWGRGTIIITNPDTIPLFNLCLRLRSARNQRVVTANGEAFLLNGDRRSISLGQITVVQRAVGPYLELDGGTVSSGSTFCSTLSAGTFLGMKKIQGSIAWDPAQIEYQSVQLLDTSLRMNNLSLGSVSGGSLSFDKTFATPQDGTERPLFKVCFTQKQVGIDSTKLLFVDVPVSTRFQRSNGDLVEAIAYGATIRFLPRIWPGDSDLNGTVDNLDLLPLGLSNGRLGPSRGGNPKSDWRAYATTPWGSKVPGSNINDSMVDADGNGVINVQDTLVILQNYGRSHDKGIPNLLGSEIRSAGPELKLKVDTLFTGPAQSIPVQLGLPSQAGNNIYGVAFSIFYSPSEIKAEQMRMTFADNWLGKKGTDFIGIQRNDPVAGRLDVALTRLDGKNASGQGILGYVRMAIQDQVLNQANKRINLRIERVRLINNLAEALSISPLSSNPTALKGTTSTFDRIWETQIRLYPQPAGDKVYIDAGSVNVKSLQILQADGRVLRNTAFDPAGINVQDLPNGLYYLRLVGEKGMAVKKMLIAR